MNLALGFLDRTGIHPIGYEELVGQSLLFAALFGTFGVIRRGTFFPNRVNAHLQGMLILSMFAAELLLVIGWISGVPPVTVVALSPVVYLFGFAALALTVDRRLAIGAVIQMLGMIVAAFAHSWVYEVIGVSGLLSAATTWKWLEPARSTAPGGEE